MPGNEEEQTLELEWVEAMSDSYLLSEARSITATQGSGSKIVTFDDRTHVVWQEHRPEGIFNIVRTLDRAAGDLAPPVILNRVLTTTPVRSSSPTPQASSTLFSAATTHPSMNKNKGVMFPHASGHLEAPS